MAYQKPLTRKQVESRINNYTKERADIDTWFDKKKAQVDKNLEMVSKKGFLKDLDITKVTDDNKIEEMIKITDEIEVAEQQGATKTTINKMWTLYGAVSDWGEKQRKKILVDSLVAKYTKMLADNFGELTEEQKQEMAKKKEDKEFYNAVKKDLDSIKIESLDNWLANYKAMYITWVEENSKGYKRSMLLEKADEVVKTQKLEILVKTYPKVGKILDIKFARLGADGSFNGTVFGEKGNCNIETILAGGYNIQRLHYRVLMK